MITLIVLMALFAISSASENRHEIEKERTIGGLNVGTYGFVDDMIRVTTGIIDETFHGVGMVFALVLGAAIFFFSLQILGDFEHRRNSDIADGYYEGGQYIKYRNKRFAPKGKHYFLFHCQSVE